MYGLHVGPSKDERTDPILSTIAAAKHLKDLYAQFGDWHLALAGYNAGPQSVLQAMKSTNSDDFWELSRRGAIPRETSNFVPKFIASTIILQHPEKFGFAG
jgi:membrane-bound lytic murein transglycosylase D